MNSVGSSIVKVVCDGIMIVKVRCGGIMITEVRCGGIMIIEVRCDSITNYLITYLWSEIHNAGAQAVV